MGGDANDGTATGRYRIGAVAEITGVPAETLRAWERRYGAVRPARGESGFRLYSQADVDRLVLMKRLCDRGNAIGSVAGLEGDEMEARLAGCDRARRARAAELVRGTRAGEAVRVVVLDPALAERIRGAGDCGLRVAAEAAAASDLGAALDPSRPAVLVLNLAHLGEDPAAEVRALLGRRGVMGAVVLYRFATKEALRRLVLSNAQVVKGPARLETLARAVREAPFAGEVARPQGLHLAPTLPTGDEPNPAPWFSSRELGRLRGAASVVGCECPHHLAGLVESLLEFEAYSARCEERHEDDAAVHRRLYREAGAARMVLERALAFLVHADGIEP